MAREEWCSIKESENAGTGRSSGTGVLVTARAFSNRRRIIESAGHAQR